MNVYCIVLFIIGVGIGIATFANSEGRGIGEWNIIRKHKIAYLIAFAHALPYLSSLWIHAIGEF